jgi:predicted DsbA family dithiol-disulfide isomerase
MKTVALTCFTDVICVWAWIGELRLAELRRTHGEAVAVTQRFCNVFGATALKIQTTWGATGGYEGFAGHLAHVMEGFPELTASPDLWRTVRPASSLPAHLALKAVQAQAAERARRPHAVDARRQHDHVAEEGRDLAVDRMAVELDRRADLGKAALAQHGDLVGEGQRLGLVVRDEDGGDADEFEHVGHGLAHRGT